MVGSNTVGHGREVTKYGEGSAIVAETTHVLDLYRVGEEGTWAGLDKRIDRVFDRGRQGVILEVVAQTQGPAYVMDMDTTKEGRIVLELGAAR